MLPHLLMMYASHANLFFLISLCLSQPHSSSLWQQKSPPSINPCPGCSCCAWLIHECNKAVAFVCLDCCLSLCVPAISGAPADTHPSGRESDPPTFWLFCERCCSATSLRLTCSGTSLAAPSSAEPWTWPLSAPSVHRCPTLTPSEDNPDMAFWKCTVRWWQVKAVEIAAFLPRVTSEYQYIPFSSSLA